MGTPVSSGNRGVLALGASLLNLFWEARPGTELTLLLVHRDNQAASFRIGGESRLVPVVNARRSPRTHPRHHVAWILGMSLLYRLVPISALRRAIARSTPWIGAVAASDLVGDIHGGDSFSDIYGLKGLCETFAMDWSVILVKGTMVQLPQTYGPYKSRIAHALARFLIRRSVIIVARDERSRKIAEDLAGPGRPVMLSPDVAFSLEVVRPARIELDPPLAAPVGPVIGLNVNGLMYHGGYTRKNMFGLKLDYASCLAPLVEALLRETPGEVWLVPHTFAPDDDVESDPAASRKVRDALPPELRTRVRIVNREYDQHEIKGVIGSCDFFIGSRMHACIAALSQGVPCVGIAYSMKFAGVFESVGMTDWVVDGRSTDQAEAIARIITLYRERDQVRQGLKQRSEAARTRLREVFARLVDAAETRTNVRS